MPRKTSLAKLVVDALEDLKALNIVLIDVQKLTSITDTMVICSGTSNRHVSALADKVTMSVKERGIRPLGIQGDRESEWVIIDLNEVIVHIMLPEVRDFYNLEKLWGTPSQEDASPSSSK